MNDQSLIVKPTDAIDNGSLLKLIQDIVPKLQTGASKTLEATKKFETVTDDNVEEVKSLLIPVRTTKEKMEALRKSVTEKTDALKEFMMAPEKEVKAEEERLRAGVAQVEQAKIKRNAEQEKIAAANKLKEQTKSDVIAKIKLNVTDVIIARCGTIEVESGKYLNENIDTIEDFDKRSETYKTGKWRMKPEEYDKCFVVPYNQSGITPAEYKELADKLKEDMTYEKVNAMFLEKAGPILNNWKNKIPQLRLEWIAKFAATDTERARLDEESKKKSAEDTKRQQEYLDQQKVAMQAPVETEKMMASVESDLREQAVVQSLDKTGPKKKVLKFNSDKPVAELSHIIYHCFMHPKFKGIIKMKDGKPVLDEQGNKEYVDAVNYFVDFFAANIDAEIKNTTMFDYAKVIIRK